MNGYELHEVLGKGAYGEVFKGVRTCDGLVVAVKKDSYGAQMAEEGILATTLREISLLKELRHPNIVCLHEAVYSKAGRVWMAMVSGGLPVSRSDEALVPKTVPKQGNSILLASACWFALPRP